MPDEKEEPKDILDLLNELIDNDQFTIEHINTSHPKIRSEYYNTLREIIETNFMDMMEIIKYAGKHELDTLEETLQGTDPYKYRILRIIRAIFYC